MGCDVGSAFMIPAAQPFLAYPQQEACLLPVFCTKYLWTRYGFMCFFAIVWYGGLRIPKLPTKYVRDRWYEIAIARSV